MEQNSSQEIPLLTFNSLYNILREEKKSSLLQNLPELFYEALEKFMEEKIKEISRLEKQSEPDKLRKENNILKNSNKISQELISLRCSKIANIAIKHQVFKEDFLSVENIIGKENIFFEEVKNSTKKITK